MRRPHHEPLRMCVACRRQALKHLLVRVVRGADGTAKVDRAGRARGRGTYLHSEAACLEIARKRRSLERALGASVPAELWAELTAS